MNPLLDNVRVAFDRLSTHPRSLAIDRKGVVLPAGCHFQGIQRLGTGRHRLFITSSSDIQGYFVPCEMNRDGTGGRANAPTTLAHSPLTHAGGCQIVGDYLSVGVEDFGSRRSSEVQFWNVAGDPAQVPSLTLKRSGPEKVSTAGAVGMSSYGGGTVLAVATWNAETVDFYATAADPFRDPRARFEFRKTWSKAGADINGWIDRNFGAYQSVNLITQPDGSLFLIGFNRSGGDDWMDLFSVDVDAPAPAMLKKLAKKQMFCSDGCSFEYGAGVYIPASTHFEVYAVKGSSGDHKSGTTIHANHFLAG